MMTLEDGGAHGLRSTYQRGCRCDSCREANRIEGRELTRSWRARRRLEIGCGPGGGSHGEQTTFWLGCRCEPCGKAHATYAAARLAERPELHGTRTAYCLYDCRCEACVEAGAAYWRTYKRPSKAGKTARAGRP